MANSSTNDTCFGVESEYDAQCGTLTNQTSCAKQLVCVWGDESKTRCFAKTDQRFAEARSVHVRACCTCMHEAVRCMRACSRPPWFSTDPHAQVVMIAASRRTNRHDHDDATDSFVRTHSASFQACAKEATQQDCTSQFGCVWRSPDDATAWVKAIAAAVQALSTDAPSAAPAGLTVGTPSTTASHDHQQVRAGQSDVELESRSSSSFQALCSIGLSSERRGWVSGHVVEPKGGRQTRRSDVRSSL